MLIFFIKQRMIQLPKKLFYVEYATEASVIVNKREFRNQLLFLATNAGCTDKLNTLVDNIEYRFSDMVAVFKNINSCAVRKQN
jgi:hypothetical protein